MSLCWYSKPHRGPILLQIAQSAQEEKDFSQRAPK